MTDIVLPVHLGHSPEQNVYQGAEAIAKSLGTSRKAVLRWKKAGAPILKIGGKYQCSYHDLWGWLKNNEKNLYPKKKAKSQKPVN